MNRTKRAAGLAAVVLAATTLGACGLVEKLKGDADAGAPSATAAATGAPAATATGVVAAAGPVVAIPAGTFRAGSGCNQVPRITNEELVLETIALGEFSIDAYPYPNDPAQPAKTGVTRDEAESLCAAQGKRLCTELEWEKACKGAANNTYEYGNTWNANSCKAEASLVPGKRAACASSYGARDMHGLVFEWTSSPWGRGSSGDLASVRGSGVTSGALQARCANGQSRAPSAKSGDLGFRCCSGTKNGANVNLVPNKQPPMVEDTALDAGLAAAMLRALPADHRALDKGEVKFEKSWRWRPRDNEELVVARWRGKLDKASFFELAVFKVCAGAPSLLARMSGPVEAVAPPAAAADAQRATARVRTKTDEGEVAFTYSYGAVRVDQPAWIKQGNKLELEATADAADAGAPARRPIKFPVLRPKK